jgi:hypothetical protein
MGKYEERVTKDARKAKRAASLIKREKGSGKGGMGNGEWVKARRASY